MTKMAKTNEIKIGPQPGPQTQFLSTPADICIYGGGAGSGKSFALLIEPIRNIDNGKFAAVIFRRTSPQILNPGGLWDEAGKLYPQLGAEPIVSALTYRFPSGMRVRFSHLEHEKDKNEWQGSQVPLIAFDEMTHFLESQVIYFLSRLRSDSGVQGYIRGTCNPDPTSFVRRWIDWYIGSDGLPIPERSGKLRYFIRVGDNMIWGNSPNELIEQYGEEIRDDILSFTFIAATIYDNQALLKANPRYLASLKALPRIERERLLGGNWDTVAQGSKYYSREWTPLVPFPSARLTKVRYWDRAATEKTETNPDPDWTVGLLMGKDNLNGKLYVLDVVRFRGGPYDVKRKIRETQIKDGFGVKTIIEQDPGQAGKTEATMLRRELSEGGYEVRTRPVTKDKLTRFLPFSAAAEHGDISVVRGVWNEDFFTELERFQGDGKGKDDQVDTCSGAFAELAGKIVNPVFNIGSMPKSNAFEVMR